MLRRCYLVTYLDGKKVNVWSQHHEVVQGALVAFYDRKDDAVVATFKYVLNVPLHALHDFQHVEAPMEDVESIGIPPYLGPRKRSH